MALRKRTSSIINPLLFIICLAIFACQPDSQSKDLIQTRKEASLPDSLPAPIGYVNDFEGLYTKEQSAFLQKLIAEFEDATTIQIALVTIPASFTKQESFDEYTLQLARTWGVGHKDKNNGILIAISKVYRYMRIQNGYGIEKLLTNEETKRIVDDFFVPAFKEANYYSGTLNGINEIVRVLKKRMTKQ